MRDEDDRMRQKNNKMEKAYLARNQIALIKGKYDDSNLQYVTSQMKCKEGVRYVEIQMAGCDADEDVTDQEMREFQRQMYECCTAFLKDYAENCVFDASADEKIYDVGLIFFQYMAEEAGLDENAYLNGLVEYLGENLSRPVTMLVGEKGAGYQPYCKIIWECLYASFLSGISKQKGHLFLRGRSAGVQ